MREPNAFTLGGQKLEPFIQELWAHGRRFFAHYPPDATFVEVVMPIVSGASAADDTRQQLRLVHAR